MNRAERPEFPEHITGKKTTVTIVDDIEQIERRAYEEFCAILMDDESQEIGGKDANIKEVVNPIANLVRALTLIEEALEEYVMHAEDVPEKREQAVRWQRDAARLVEKLTGRKVDDGDEE